MPSSRFVARLAMALMLAAGFAWAQDNDTIADVAGRKPAAHARRVITNDDLPPSPQPDPTPSLESREVRNRRRKRRITLPPRWKRLVWINPPIPT